MEILVAVVILSVGLLGLAGLQVMGLKNISLTGTHANAAILANHLMERMHVNSADIASYVGLAGAGCPDNSTIARMDYCDVYAQAIGDLNKDGNVDNATEVRLLRAMPGIELVDISPCAACAGAGMYTITISWAEKDLEGNDQLRTYGFNFRP